MALCRIEWSGLGGPLLDNVKLNTGERDGQQLRTENSGGCPMPCMPYDTLFPRANNQSVHPIKFRTASRLTSAKTNVLEVRLLVIGRKR